MTVRTHPRSFALPSSRDFRRFAGRMVLALLDFVLLVFGRRVDLRDENWLDGDSEPGDVVGPCAHLRIAGRVGLDVWEYPDAGLLEDFSVLESSTFDPARLAPSIARFYEETAAHRLTVDADWSGPVAPLARMTIGSAGVAADNLNLPLDSDELAAGLDSRIISLSKPSGEPHSTCWLRRKRNGEVVYAGFYGTAHVPARRGRCVKTVFPIPRGHITVLLEPTHHPDGGLDLRSDRGAWGDAGFYVCRRVSGERARVIKLPLGESIRVFEDAGGLRTTHRFSFMGSHFLTLHYRIERR